MGKSFTATVTRMHHPQSRALHPKSKSSLSGIKNKKPFLPIRDSMNTFPWQQQLHFIVRLLKMKTALEKKDQVHCNVIQNSIEGAIVIQQKDALVKVKCSNPYSGVTNRFFLVHIPKKKKDIY